MKAGSRSFRWAASMTLARLTLAWLTLALGVIVLAGAQNAAAPADPPAFSTEMLDSMAQLPGELTALPKPPEPAENPQSAAKIELGRLLFHDKRISSDRSISCATCHDPDKAYSDGRKKAVGINRKVLPRRSPSLLNSAYNSSQFWDGRARSLEEQSAAPMLARDEMGMLDPHSIIAHLEEDAEYRRRFQDAFGRDINMEDIQRAIAAFERTLVTPDSAFDRYIGGDKQALTLRQKRGLILFFGKAACTECHNGPNFTDNKFHSLGLLPGELPDADVGRFAVTGDAADRHAFKTPSLRSAAYESAYMHDGSIATLAGVIDFYVQGGGSGPKSKLVFKLQLTESEKEDLLAFLQSLAGRMPEEGHRR
jgi:cytochrome c peroxidase